MPDEYLDADGTDVTRACLDDLRPLVGPMPDYARLAVVPA
jgi:hypothetical protein